ncbi:HEPN domain-containing protein [Paraflavitalea sp. CAU 1676]|uniref:HEPN domain-containing protein n=1 Tax=Paraflavitalea sp. CAU 1676 TaxID=3032598 RepID=UPI0023D9B66C|nr:HEPN domain-containing protein [Paraflavitalea sp. CAU 1676]MDF2186816.1 HEPN domain-containing protein [Paraflavitalea sp. CAU 1676]
MIEDIMYTFDKNFLRLNNLISLYKTIAVGQGRKPANSLDILRATTVLTHATLEDYLRNLLEWKLPTQGREKIETIPLVGTSAIGRPTKFTLGDLVAHRNQSVDIIIKQSVKEYLGTMSFNDTSDIAKALVSIALVVTPDIQGLFPAVNEMIKRRHNIVHRADRVEVAGSGNHSITSISVQKVEKWKNTVDKLVFEINKNFIV